MCFLSAWWWYSQGRRSAHETPASHRHSSPFLAAASTPLPPFALITPAFLISFLACKLKTKTESHVISLSYFFLLWSVLSPFVLSIPSMSHSAEPPPAKTDSNLEADERAAAG